VGKGEDGCVRCEEGERDEDREGCEGGGGRE
jgi:hypothetical protein